MKLPNYDEAIVSREKIIDYLLSQTHKDGKGKAGFFMRFGFVTEKWEVLAESLRRHAAEHEVIKSETSPFGMRYIIEGETETPDGRKPNIRVMVYRTWQPYADARNGLSGEAKRSCKMIKELDQIVLKEDLPDHGLKAGDIGTVVLIHQLGKGYEVEFVALDGETLAVISVYADQIRTIAKREIARARAVEIPLAA